MNARRRSADKYMDFDESKNSSCLDSTSPQSPGDPSENIVIPNDDSEPVNAEYEQAIYPATDQNAICGTTAMVPHQDSGQLYTAHAEYPLQIENNNPMNQQIDPRVYHYPRPDTLSSQYPFGQYSAESQASYSLHQQTPGPIFDLRRLASASQIDPHFLATATEFSASHQSLRDQALEICSNMVAAAAVASANAKFNASSGVPEAHIFKQEAEAVVEYGDNNTCQR